mmetsp:Transcript_56152/g.64437  ORF Transcript_56152/g.64437 Transcript_56152/m.64437 type:complete len:89 (-) Transcript_56152:182-448(-)
MIVRIQFRDAFEGILIGALGTLDCESKDTIENVKLLISAKYPQLAGVNFRLYYKSRALRDQQTLQSASYEDGSVIYVARGKSGCCTIF